MKESFLFMNRMIEPADQCSITDRMTSRIVFVRELDPDHYQISSLHTPDNPGHKPAGGAAPEPTQRNSSDRSRKRPDKLADSIC